MSGFISRATLDARRARYRPGMRVELVSMSDPLADLKPGDQGWVDEVDDIGTVFIRWDNGSELGAAYGADVIRPVPLPMTDAVRDQLLAIRATGKVNMLDVLAVRQLAVAHGFWELADYTAVDPAAYASFVLTGELSQSRTAEPGNR